MDDAIFLYDTLVHEWISINGDDLMEKLRAADQLRKAKHYKLTLNELLGMFGFSKMNLGDEAIIGKSTVITIRSHPQYKGEHYFVLDYSVFY